MSHALIFDFDGLICDGLHECILTTWNAWHDLTVEHFSANQLARIPADYKQRFARCRAYSRHLGHFVLSFDPELDRVTTQAQFDARFERHDSAVVERFVSAANRYRGDVREQLPERWLSEQSIYPGLAQTLTALHGSYYIATAKDADSVVAILHHHGVIVARDRVYGECRSKEAVFDQVADREGVAREALWFFDDNVFNVTDAARLGCQAYWADWGYHAPDHAVYAEETGLRHISLPELNAMPWRGHGPS